MPDLLANLNPSQVQAVTTTEGYVRVIAGAGTGKTRALTHRYAYLVNEYGISPSNILCITFTNKAANEMKKRIKSMLGDSFDTSFVATLHAFCTRVLREEISKLFYPENFITREADFGEPLTLTDFLRHITLLRDSDAEDTKDCVKIMTIHTAKGLEFDRVCLVGLTEGIFPSARSMEERVDEQTRTYYIRFVNGIRPISFDYQGLSHVF